MLKKLIPLSFAFAGALIMSTLMFAQESSKPEGMKENPPTTSEKSGEHKAPQQDRWEGVVVRSSKDSSTLTVRKIGSSTEKIIHYDNSTRWVSQEHGSKKVNKIDPSDVKDGDRVIVRGSEQGGEFHATLISKRLSHI